MRLGRPTRNLGFRVHPLLLSPVGATGHLVSLPLASNKHKQLVSWEMHLQGGGDWGYGLGFLPPVWHIILLALFAESHWRISTALFSQSSFSLLDFWADLLPGTRHVRQRMRNSLGAPPGLTSDIWRLVENLTGDK